MKQFNKHWMVWDNSDSGIEVERDSLIFVAVRRMLTDHWFIQVFYEDGDKPFKTEELGLSTHDKAVDRINEIYKELTNKAK